MDLHWQKQTFCVNVPSLHIGGLLQPKNTVFAFEFYSWQDGKASALIEKHGKLLDTPGIQMTNYYLQSLTNVQRKQDLSKTEAKSGSISSLKNLDGMKSEILLAVIYLKMPVSGDDDVMLSSTSRPAWLRGNVKDSARHKIVPREPEEKPVRNHRTCKTASR